MAEKKSDAEKADAAQEAAALDAALPIQGKAWMVWKGPAGAHTPPLPSRDLGEAEVKLYITSMEMAKQFEQTGMWELHIPDGEIRKTAPDVPTGG